MNKFWSYLLIMSALLLIDQISKGVIQSTLQLGEGFPVIAGFFDITRVHNTGAAFGFMAGAHENLRKFLFLLIPVLVCVWLIVLIWKSRKEPYMVGFCYSLILVGAIGNLIDRFTLGYVVDFLDFYIGDSHYPAFNVADSCITVAAILLGFDFLKSLMRKKT
ncbi:MAG: signal peptidase II [Bacteriovoracaceae bacterium]|nr:signal peptidase II [Bacteriovoracaceae bacterium]